MFILGRLFFVEVVDASFFQQKAIDQWTRALPIKAQRGDILDANGEALATADGTFAVYVRPRSVDNAEQVSSVLSEIFGVDKIKLLEKIEKVKSSEITIARQVDDQKIEKLLEYSLNGVYYTEDTSRVYPYNTALSQIIGFTANDGTGLAGLEKYYDKYLKGKDGEVLYEADLVGKDLDGKKPSYLEASDGLSIKLNIDLGIQRICEGVLDKVNQEYTPKSASIIVVNPNSGKIVSLATTPGYDLNNPPKDDIASLNVLSRSPVIVDSYEPGSTFKIVTALANVEETLKGNEKALPLNYIYNSNRYRIVQGRKIKCWSSHNNGKHSNQTLQEALNNSCNPCFVDIALSLGKQKMYEYIEKLGFGNVCGIDFYGEASGMVLPMSAVSEGDIARISFGQTIAVTPLQLAMAVSAIVNGGTYYTPQLVSEIINKNGETVERIIPGKKGEVASQKACEIVRGYLEQVVAVGSGKQAYIEGYRVGGKTGTAQKYQNGVIAQGKYVMSFIGFFPANKPEYLALCVVDEPVGGQYGSTVAAPIVKEVFQKIIELKKIKPFI